MTKGNFSLREDAEWGKAVIRTLQFFVCVHVRVREKRGRKLREESKEKGV